MKRCSVLYCIPICDFCKFYNDYSNFDNTEFQGIGICEFDNTEVLASDYCYNNFHCFNVKEE